MRCCPSPVLFLMFCALAAPALGEDEPLHLRPERTLHSPPHGGNDAPAFLSARRLEGQKGNQIEASGDAELRREGQAIFADHLLYRQDSRDLTADGAVRIEQNGDVLTGLHLEYNLDSKAGDLNHAGYRLAESNARGGADDMHMDGKGNYALRKVTYTTCPAGNDDWMLDMGRLDIDRATQIGVAHNAFVEFKGVPILYSPWMDFPLKGQRKTGLLAPVFGSTTTGGFELTVPFYWNIAPNYDATYPRSPVNAG